MPKDKIPGFVFFGETEPAGMSQRPSGALLFPGFAPIMGSVRDKIPTLSALHACRRLRRERMRDPGPSS